MDETMTIIEDGIVPVYETDNGEKVVFGRELWQILGSKQQFADWIKKRISECDAVENEDFSIFHKKMKNSGRGRGTIDYIIKLDTAKEMAMLERNKKGKQVRRYLEGLTTAITVAIQNEPLKKESVQYIDSREVAKMVEKEHSKLLRDIRKYITDMAKAKIGLCSNDFFLPSEYSREDGRKYSCYLVTKKGCEFIAHKLTGTKGTIFTARYINRFHEMENTLSTNDSVVHEFMKQQMAFNKKFTEWMQEKEERDIRNSERKRNGNPFMPCLTQSHVEEIGTLAREAACLCEIDSRRLLHYLYLAIEAQMGISISPYSLVYGYETGKEPSTLEVVASYPSLYNKAISNLTDLIERKKLFE